MDYKLKNEVRAFRLTQFRNIGYGKDSDEHSTLILNYSLNHDYMGDLVILIGPNNSGKSNVLNALSRFANRNISEEDFSDTKMDENNQNPNLKLFTSDKPNEYIDEYSLDKNNNLEYKNPGKVYKQPSFGVETHIQSIKLMKKQDFQNELNLILNLLRKYQFDASTIKFVNYNQFPQNYGMLDQNYIVDNLTIIQNILKVIFENRNKDVNYKQLITDLISHVEPFFYNFITQYLKFLEETENLKWLPKKHSKIIKYDEQNITDEDLKCKVAEIGNNKFFNAVIKILNLDKSIILNIYRCYESNHHNDSILHQGTKDFNRRLKNDAENLFNELYCIGEDKYRFEFNFQPEYISFNLFKYDHLTEAEIGLTLNHQSTGFRWFFNFFFNIFASNNFNAGDIIIMDEPATNLHVKGQEELRNFLKKFAIQSGITFIIATHSPFLVDLDYLDEVRLLLPQSDNTTWINNNFTTVNPDDADSLLPIRESLTIRNSILLDPKQMIIFIEGITDYNYFVAMKKLIGGFDNLTFLPINGLGNSKQNKEKLEQLRKIRNWNSLIITDGDWQGEKFCKLNENDSNPLPIIKLTDVDSKFKEIENLFDEKDQDKFNIKNLLSKDDNDKWNKNIGLSVTFKKIIQKEIWNAATTKSQLSNIVEVNTVNNFKKIFKYLVDFIDKNNNNLLEFLKIKKEENKSGSYTVNLDIENNDVSK